MERNKKIKREKIMRESERKEKKRKEEKNRTEIKKKIREIYIKKFNKNKNTKDSPCLLKPNLSRLYHSLPFL
jgi:hypothetical protein